MKKPLRILKNQLINTILMVALTVPLLVVAVNLEPNKPTLSFEGARIQVHQDGSVQLLFDVCIRNAPRTSGAQFMLAYNFDYITPSDYETNEALIDYPNIVKADSAKAFRKTPDLYRVDTDGDGLPDTNKDPFKKSEDFISDGYITLRLLTDSSIDPDDPAEKGFGMERVRNGEKEDEYYNVFDASDKVVLGTLSFRVLDPDLMPEITERFDGLVDVVFEGNHAKDKTDVNFTEYDQLIYFERKGSGNGWMPWAIDVHEKSEDDYQYLTINDNPNNPRAQAAFTYRFPRTIIKARAAEAELTINAYQAYTNGRVGDIDYALQRYSPAITVTYSDGSEGNFIMPWGRETDDVDGLPWTATVAYDLNDSSKPVVVDGESFAGEISYDPTASRYKPDNQRYLVQKNFCYEEEDFNGVKQKKTFPVPIDVRLTVTPITLVDVTATDLHRSYLLKDSLVDPVTGIQSAGALKLPNQARLITDVPAGGITLTMDIPGWSHVQDNGYWPSERITDPDTSAVLSGTGTEMLDLWKDGADTTTSAYLHWPVPTDIETDTKWMTPESNDQYRGANRAGVYTFRMATAYGGTPTYFTRLAIRAVYPWLTVPDGTKVPTDIEAWPIDDATRTIVWNEDPAKQPDPENPDDPKEPPLEDIDRYQVRYISTVDGTNDQPEFTLGIRKTDDRGTPASMLPDSVFRIRLPDGTEMAVGYKDDKVDQGGDWFADNDGSYRKQSTTWGDFNDRIAFDLTTNPGDPTKNSYGTEREKLRRYINLGGWFSVAIKEIDNTEGNETQWSDFIPVYVPPRDNYYTQSKVYNFIGSNAGLYPWSGGLSTTVILPPGTYHRVDDLGNPVYTDVVNGIRAEERYDLTTTYDGATGAQPGRLSTFTVDPVPDPAPDNDWRRTNSTITVGGTTKAITTYGSEVFRDGAVYMAYGKVLNLLTGRGTMTADYRSDAETATIRVEELDQSTPDEKIILEYVATHGGERSIDYDDTYGYDAEYRERYNVSNVIFETRTQGYTMRQDYVLRIRNMGDVDISGLNIDFLTDLTGNPVYDKSLDHDPAGGHFEILKPPASFLPAGESTEFVITYVYNLNAAGSTPVDYRDKLFITSNSHHRVPTGPTTDGGDYLLDFDAQFQVTASEIHRVTVRVIPTDSDGNPIMGTAGVIMGEATDGSGNTTMNIAAGPTAFSKGNTVYIVVTPYDEYTRHSVTAIDSTGTNLYIDLYSGSADIPDGHQVYVFTMPDYDTTVTVTFQEPISSKLRLSDLRVYADRRHDTTQIPEDLYPHNEDWNTGDRDTNPMHKDHFERRIWQKSFTTAEQTTAATYTRDDGASLYLMTKGKAVKPDFDSQVNQYLVVLPADADWAQVEVDLRAVEYIFTGNPIVNLPLTGVIVQMTLYNTDNVNDMVAQVPATTTNIYPTTFSQGNFSGAYATTGETNGPTTHTSIPFLSPEPGTSKYVRIQLSYREEDPNVSEENRETITRAYYVELYRAPREVDATLNYGNSPYGMIMNDPAIINKGRAKDAFVGNNYTFRGMVDTLVPRVVKDNGLLDLHYWLEAWAPPTETWTAPDANWTKYGDVYDADTGMSQELYDQVHDSRVNLDLNDYAFFATMGEAFLDPGIARATDSSGRPVDLSTAVLSLTAYTLDTSASVDKTKPDDQLVRFALPTDPDDLAARTVTFGFLDATYGRTAVSGDRVTSDWSKWYLTPTGELTQDPTGNELVELRPGRYQLSYTFPDYDNIPADPENGVEAEPSYLTVTRDFVVLAPVGDVNADVLTTGTDAKVDETLLEGRIAPNAGYPALGYMADNYDYAAIFKLRTCDVNNDRNINNIDANAIKEQTAVKRFYLSVDYKPTVTP